MLDNTFSRTLPRYLSLACLRAVMPHRDKRSHMLGAVGVRADGTVVSARNGSVVVDRHSSRRHPSCHAEMRVLAKMDVGGVVYVARVLASGRCALARPCEVCMGALKRRVSKVVYTIADGEYGTLVF
jgi:tRNA(Arg) A34 adenosine deaminase TadA